MSDAMPAAASRIIEEQMRTSAAPDAVYAAWADPQQIAQWFVDRATGVARTDGSVTWRWDAFGVDAVYDVVAAEPGERLVLRAPPCVAPPGIIELTIRRAGGETVLTIVNSGFLDGAEWDELIEGVRSGWTLALAMLKEYLEHYSGRPKRTFVHMQAADVGFATLPDWFGNESHLKRWLTTSGEPRTGGEFPLVLRDGTRVDAHVIARTARELALALRSEEAVLELKAFSIPAAPPSPDDELPAMLRAAAQTQRIVCLRGTSWANDPARFDWLRDLSADALNALVAQLRHYR